MAIVIGANTHVSFGSGCVISANWGLSPNSQRLFCLGSWTPYITINKPTSTLSVTCYAPGPDYATLPTLSCSNANTISASVSPGTCGGVGGDGVSGNWYVTSYSFSKDDAIMPGQESWSMMQYVGENMPSFVLRGISEGSGTLNSGIDFETISASSSTGSVSAGGFGRADTLTAGTVNKVGGGSSIKGETGQGSASIPYTPIYID
jgi:hypothetical protein